MRSQWVLTVVPGWALLALALAAVAYSVFTVSAAPLGSAEVTYRLQAESLGRDGDVVYDENDRSRFVEKGWEDREAKVVVSLDRKGLRYHRPLPYALALAPFVRLAPERGPYILNLLLLLGLALALTMRMNRYSPKSAPYWTAALVFGTPVFAYARAAWPELFVGSLLAAAYLLTRDDGPADPLLKMAPRRTSQMGGGARWLCVGVLTALAVLQEPIYAICLVAFLVPAFRTRTETAWAAGMAGFALVLLVAWMGTGSLFAGVSPWAADHSLPVRAGDSIEDVTRWTERLDSVGAPELIVDAQLWLWDGVYSLIGRHVGVVATFLPLALFAATGGRRRGLIWGAAAAVLVLAVFLEPFNFFGGPEALGNRRMVPVLILCFFAVRAALPVWPALLAGFVGAVMISPLWFDLSAHPRTVSASAVVAPVAARLPFESSQRYIPASAEAVSRLLLVRPTNDSIEPGTGSSQFVLVGGSVGELMVAAAGPLEHFDLEFTARAGTELELEGGVVRDLLLRPEGGITFRLGLDDAVIRHRVWGRDDVHHVHNLRLSMPGDRGDQPFSVSARPRGNNE